MDYTADYPRLLEQFLSVDTFVVTVSPMDKSGYFSLGTSNDYASTAARCCRRLIVEVNDQMPRVFGESLLHVSEVDAIVENNVPLIEVPSHAARAEDDAIGRAIADLIPDGATLQLGIGGIPEAVTRFLGGQKDLGIHTEVFSNGMVDLIEQGNFISINSILEVDLTGQCNAESLSGHEYSSTGGQLDFVRGAFASRGGKSFLAFYATAASGRVSRVVPRLESAAIVTTPRTDTEFLATEFGVVNLKGKSVCARALGIIGIAHPSFRDGLIAEAQQLDVM